LNNLCPDRKRVTRKVSGGEITNYGDNPRKKLLAVTMVTVLSIVAIVSVYAVLIGTFPGGEVTVGGAGGYIRYNVTDVDSGTWNTTLISSGAGVAWYSRLEIPSGGYSGPVKITWQLQNKTDALNWANVTGANQITDTVLTGGLQNVYASSDGTFATGNHDWGAHSEVAGAYRVMAYAESA